MSFVSDTHSAAAESSVWCSADLRCINLTQSVRWAGYFPCHSVMQHRSALYLLLIIPTLRARHGPDNSSHLTPTCSQMDRIKIYCQCRSSVCSASPRGSVCILTFGRSWRGFKRSRCRWSALPALLPSPNWPSVIESAFSPSDRYYCVVLL